MSKMKDRWKDPEFRQKMSGRYNPLKELWADPVKRNKRISKMITTHAATLRNKPPTEFEERCYVVLDSLHLDYERHHPIIEAHTIVDAYVESMKLCIYFDSEYWHSLPANPARDTEKRERLRSLGYVVKSIRCDRWARRINQQDIANLSAFCLRFRKK